MLPQPTAVEINDKDTLFHYNGSDLDSIVAGVESFFTTKKYRLENGTPDNGTYGIGSNIRRILLGAFAKRYVFIVKIITSKDDNNTVIFKLEKAISGAMGGVIGYKKMNKEYQMLVDELSNGIL